MGIESRLDCLKIESDITRTMDKVTEIVIKITVPKPIYVDGDQFEIDMGHAIDMALAPYYSRPAWGGDESAGDYVGFS